MLGEEVDHRCVADLGMVGLQPMRCLWNLQKAPCLKTAGKDLGDPLQPGRASAATDNQRRRADLSRILASEARPRRLEVELEGSDGREKYTIVGAAEAAPLEGRISNESPVGRSLLGKKKGDKITVAVPAGDSVYKIVSIS